MIKWLIVVGVVGLIYFMFIKKKPAVAQEKKAPKSEPKNEIQGNDMVECSTCSVFVSVDDMTLSNNKYYCSDECLEKNK